MTFVKNIDWFGIIIFSAAICSGQTITVGSTTEQLTASQRASVANYWPDGTMGAINYGGTTYIFAPTANPGTVQITLANLNTWSSGLTLDTPTTNIPFGGSGAFDQNYTGGGAVYYDSTTGILVQLYHGEQWFGGSGSPFYSAHGLAYSTDFGNHWTKLGEVVSPQSARVNNGSNCQAEVGTGSLVVVGSYLYDYFTDTSAGCGSLYLSVARAPIASVVAAAQAGTTFTSGPGTLFMKYTGNETWNGDGVTDLANPQNGGGASTQIGPTSVSALEPVVRYNSYLSQYLLCYSNDFTDIECSWSADGLTGWTSPQVIITGGSAPPNAIYYPSLFNTSGGDPQTLGQNFSLFWVQPFGTWSNSNLNSASLSVGQRPLPPILNQPIVEH